MSRGDGTVMSSGLDALFSREVKGRVILVEGNPGTGKTILSTQYLYDGAMHGEKGMYVSFFEDDNSFRHNAKSLGLDMAPLERKKLFKIVHCIAMTREGMRESIGDIFRAILTFKPRRLVFDSISSVLQVMEQDETRAFLGTIFGDFRHREMTSLLIGEIPFGDGHTVDGVTDFFADGVVRLNRTDESPHLLPRNRLRNLEILKMRGMRLTEPNRFFSLENGFHLINRPSTSETNKPTPWKTVKDADSKFSSGSKDLDKFLGGGFPKGQYAVLETDPNVPIEVIRLFQFPLAWNFLSQDRSVLMLPTLGAESEEIKKLVTAHISEEVFARRMRIFERVRAISRLHMGEGPSYVISAKPGEPIEKTEELLNQICLDMISETGKPVLRLIGFPTLENIYAGRLDLLLKFIGEAVAQNKLVGNFTLAVSRTDVEVTRRALDIVDWHLRLIERNGYHFVRVVKPEPTGYFAVETEASQGCPTLKLTPMV